MRLSNTEEHVDWTVCQRFFARYVGARLRGRPEQDIEDVCARAQVALLRALRRAGMPDNLEAYMSTIANARIKDYLRALAPPPEEVSPEFPDAGACAELLPDPESRLQWIRFVVLQFFAEHERCQELARAYFAEENWRVVADRLEISHASIRQTWKRCLDRLRQSLSQSATLARLEDLLPGEW